MNYYAAGSFHGSGEKPLLRQLKTALQGHSPVVIVDGGANLGDYALEARRVFGPTAQIYSLEPAPDTFAELSRRVEGQGIHCLPFGLSDSPGEAQLYSSEPGSTIASLYAQKNPLRPFRPEFSSTVRLRTLDELFLEHGWDHIHLLKLDLEGHEYSALLGASQALRRGAIGYIQFEFGEVHLDVRQSLRDFFELLQPTHGLHRIVSNGLVALPRYHAELEIFATANYLAVPLPSLMEAS